MSHVPRQLMVSLPLAPSIREKLASAGYRTTADFEGVKALDLAAEAGLSPEEALLALKVSCRTVATDGRIQGAVSAVDLLEKEQRTTRIVTFCPLLDKILGGGVPPGQITEFCGVPGVGKTQVGMQLAVDVQIPAAFKGVGGAAVYLDSEGSCMSDRVVDIATAAVKHIHKIAAASNSHDKKAAAAAFTVESILSNMYYFRIRDAAEQLAAVKMLPDFIATHPQVKVVVMDSITFHWRQHMTDMARRSRTLAAMALELMQLAHERDVAVVLMNQVTTQLSGHEVGKLVPALGDSWSHAATNRVILYWQQQQRFAYLYKSPSLPAAVAEYMVTAEGIRGRRPAKRARPEEGHQDA